MITDRNIITIRTRSNKPDITRRIDLRELPTEVTNRIIIAALVVATDAGMCRISAEDNDTEAESDLEELANAIHELERCGVVTQEPTAPNLRVVT